MPRFARPLIACASADAEGGSAASPDSAAQPPSQPPPNRLPAALEAVLSEGRRPHGDSDAYWDFFPRAGRHERAQEVTEFYEVRPFPGYAASETRASLSDRLGRSPFLKSLDASVPARARVLDAGCGTGQLSAYLALCGSRRSIVSVDACSASLGEASGFRQRAGLDHWHLLRADLFDLPVEERAFDVVLSRGVVHHTPDPERATREVARRVKPGGILVLGFYESLGRLFHRMRMRICQVTGKPLALLDPVLRRKDLSDDQREAWIADQYRHPLEVLLPAPRVADWLRSEDFEVLRSVPPHADGEALFTRSGASRPGEGRVRLGWLLAGPRDADAGLVFLVAQRCGK
jgi:SAM-dependent methyltransferase